ncbi:MAG: GIY-YIG nuclease family protein [Candidatus Edwardsbacteria bacterium]|jgi:putative endonuclease|nr:GIY-YIG nuclease family protein [Candidatus Edwardsbacteria bacterium]
MLYYTYILASKRNGTLYIGVTCDLKRRIVEHKQHLIDGFTERYHVVILVHWEEYPTFDDAVTREKRLKKWNRKWKLDLIEKTNPGWKDLYDELR